MRTFILRARTGPTTPENVRPNVGGPSHVEVISQTVIAALFVAKDVRDDVRLHVCLDGPSDPPKTLSFSSPDLYRLQGFHEDAITADIERGLAASTGLARGEQRSVDSGYTVSRMSFEATLRQIAATSPAFILSRKGHDIRGSGISTDSCFVLSDHVPMPPKTIKLMRRLGVREISLGPRMLFAAHCVVIVHNELDRSIR